jgi:hypothetical protein
MLLRLSDEKNEIGGKCSTRGGRQEVKKVSSESLKRRPHLEDHDVAGRIM